MAGESLDLVNFKQLWDTKDSLASTIASYWSQWYADKAVHMQRIREVKEFLYATSTRETSNAKNQHAHSTHIPKLTQIADNLKANYMYALVPNKNWFIFSGEDQNAVKLEVRRGLEAYLRTKHRQRKFKDKLSILVDDWINEGNAFCAVVFVKENNQDSDGEQLSGYSGPDIVRIAPNDIVFNLAASSFAKAPKIIRSIRTFGEVAREVEENPESAFMQDILNRMAELRHVSSGVSTEDINKYAQTIPDGFGSVAQYLKSGFVEFLDFYGDIYDVEKKTLYKNYVITVVDRRWVIRKQAVDTWKGSPMIFHAGWRKRADNLWAMSPLENLIGMQYKINHLENAKADAFDMMLAPDTAIIGDVEDIVTEANGSKTYYIASERGDVKLLRPDTTVLNADFQIQAYEERMELYAGAPREAMGVRTPGEKTKFEVATLDNARGRLFQFKTSEFESQFVEDILNAQIELSRKSLVGNAIDLIMEEDASTGTKLFREIRKEDLTANGKMIAQGATHYARMAQLVQNLNNFMALMSQDKELQNHFPSSKLAAVFEQLLEFEEFDMVQLYGRISERLEVARLNQAAQRKVTEEATVETAPPEAAQPQ